MVFPVLVVGFSFTTNSSPSKLFLAPLTFIDPSLRKKCSILAFLENALWVGPPYTKPPPSIAHLNWISAIHDVNYYLLLLLLFLVFLHHSFQPSKSMAFPGQLSIFFIIIICMYTCPFIIFLIFSVYWTGVWHGSYSSFCLGL